jgi:hypothetical protein
MVVVVIIPRRVSFHDVARLARGVTPVDVVVVVDLDDVVEALRRRMSEHRRRMSEHATTRT